MILHRPVYSTPLVDFGISIPSSPDRINRILDELRSDPLLGPIEDRWLIGDDGGALTREDLERAHSRAFVEQLLSGDVERILMEVYELVDSNGNYHRYEPQAAKRPLRELFDRSLRSQAGTYQGCREAADRGFCFYLGGGGHHAHWDFGHGFCIINDIVVAVRRMQAEKRIGAAWIIDVDAHKGDGVAAITAGDNSIITLSAHMARGWPLDIPERRPDGSPHPSHVPSDIDIPIERGEEAEYCGRLREGLEGLRALADADFALVELGADPYEKDALPSTQLLQLNLDQMLERDLMIYDFLMERRIPAAFIMSGGYGEHAWEPYPPFLTRVLKRRLGLD